MEIIEFGQAISLTRLKNSFVYLAVILDVFTRTIRTWFLSRTLDQQLTLEARVRFLYPPERSLGSDFEMAPRPCGVCKHIIRATIQLTSGIMI